MPEACLAPVLQHGAALLYYCLVQAEGGRFDTVLDPWDQPYDSNQVLGALRYLPGSPPYEPFVHTISYRSDMHLSECHDSSTFLGILAESDLPSVSSTVQSPWIT